MNKLNIIKNSAKNESLAYIPNLFISRVSILDNGSQKAMVLIARLLRISGLQANKFYNWKLLTGKSHQYLREYIKKYMI